METQIRTKLPMYEASPLIDPTKIPVVGFLGGVRGKEILDEYQGRAKADYNSAKALNVLSYEDGLVKGSNPPSIVLLNQILRQEGLRTADQVDLERALKTGALDLGGTYEDSALILRSPENPNKALAKILQEQIQARNPKIKRPVMIPLYGLELVNDPNSNYALSFKLRDNAKIIYAPILNKQGRFSSEDIDENGIPKNVGDKGPRNLYSGNSGLSRLYLVRGLGLYSGGVDLANSGSFGRVVVVQEGGEATAQNLKDRIVGEVNESYERQLAELTTRRERALRAIEGNGN